MIVLWRRFLFPLTLATIPVLLLAVAEGLFRLTGLFEPEPLVVDVPGSDGAFVSFNPVVGRRYFDVSPDAIPRLTLEAFQRTKSVSTFRVLCLGESSTAGFPFESQVPFPRQLRQLLMEAYPEKQVEVLNAGMESISSYVIVDLLPELLETSPDVVLVYTGHNEFYGVHGSALTLPRGRSDAVVRASLAVQKTRIGEMARRILNLLSPSSPESTATDVLIKRLAGDEDIVLGSPRYARTIESFRVNLGRIASACKERKIPVIFGTLVSNDRDQPPFHSVIDASRGHETILRGQLLQGEQLLAEGDWREGGEVFQRVLQDDSGSADAHYGFARALMMKGDTAAARGHFVAARNQDAMRFRASSEANSILASVANENGVALVDLADIFAARAAGRVIGREWMSDHLHPNPQGYYVMAAAYFVAIQKLRLLPPPDSLFRPRQTAFGVTSLDWDIGLMRIFAMTHRPPFRNRPGTLDDYVPVGDSGTVRIAREYLFGHHAWSRAHTDMAQEYLRRGDRDAARREYQALAVYSRDDPWPYQMIAETYADEENWPMRSTALREALKRPGPKGMLAYHLGLCEAKMGRAPQAIRALTAAAEAPEFTSEELANARFHLADLLSNVGQTKDAIDILSRILQADSTHASAKKLLSSLERGTR
jgi:tetratricopeptide (TPR) repeat protein